MIKKVINDIPIPYFPYFPYLPTSLPPYLLFSFILLYILYIYNMISIFMYGKRVCTLFGVWCYVLGVMVCTKKNPIYVFSFVVAYMG